MFTKTVSDRSKLSVYRSSGTSYSASQKNLISPFCGKALQTVSVHSPYMLDIIENLYSKNIDILWFHLIPNI